MPPMNVLRALLVRRCADKSGLTVPTGHRGLSGVPVGTGWQDGDRHAHQYLEEPGLRRSASVYARWHRLFTSVRGGRKPDPANSAATGSDIYRYEIATERLSQVTKTPEAEYSPTVTPDGGYISVIRVEADGTQRLWQFALDGTQPELVFGISSPSDIMPGSATSLVLFVLGQQGQPATLQVADVQTGRAEIAATGIGRSLQRIPGGGVSFVLRETAPRASRRPWPSARSTRVAQTRPLVRAPPEPPRPTPRGHRMACSSRQSAGS